MFKVEIIIIQLWDSELKKFQNKFDVGIVFVFKVGWYCMCVFCPYIIHPVWFALVGAASLFV